MVHEMIDGTYRQTNLPNESPEYLAKREEVRLAEIELLNVRKEADRSVPNVYRLDRWLQWRCSSPRAKRRLRDCRSGCSVHLARARAKKRLGQTTSAKRWRQHF
jgi:hypothetical protein